MSPPTTPAAMMGMTLLVLAGGGGGGGGLIVGRVYLEGVRELLKSTVDDTYIAVLMYPVLVKQMYTFGLILWQNQIWHNHSFTK